VIHNVIGKVRLIDPIYSITAMFRLISDVELTYNLPSGVVLML